MREIVKAFAEEMDKILDEKFDEHQDSWEDEPLDSIGTNLQAQVSNFVLRDHLKMSKEDVMRTAVRAGNFACFIFSRLKELTNHKYKQLKKTYDKSVYESD